MDRRRLITTVLAGVLVPFSDDFSDTDNRWTGAGFAVGSGVATITPTLGAEILTNPGFDSNTTGWTAENCTLASIAGGQAGNCLEITRTAEASQQARATKTVTAGNWILITGYVKSGTSGNESAQLLLQDAAGVYTVRSQPGITSSASWAQIVGSGRVGEVSANFKFIKNSATAGTMLFDTGSMKALMLATQFASVQAGTPNCTVQVKITRTANTQAGIVVNLDSSASPANFIIGYLDATGNAKLDECVNGSYTNKISAAVTYGAGKILKIVKSGTSCSLYYDGAQVGTTQTMTANTNTRHGLFSTYASNSFDDFSLTTP